MNGFEILALLPARIARRICVGAVDACWLWTGCCNGDGYGQVKLEGKTAYAHRLVLEAKLGRKLERQEETRHSCDNPPCCNPNHLEPGSSLDNVHDRVARGRGGGACGDRNGARMYPERLVGKGERRQGCLNGRAKLTEVEVRKIFEFRVQGFLQREIAVRLGCSKSNVGSVLRGERWVHLGLRSCRLLPSTA